MPIKPENKARYPADWQDVRVQIMSRAGYRCEWEGCGARHLAVGVWRDGLFKQIVHPSTPGTFDFELAESIEKDERIVRIVLTIAHLDHVPEHCDPENLRAWCQRHHLAYDQPHHITSAYMTRKLQARTTDLFPTEGEA
jgi:hypothetical protein